MATNIQEVDSLYALNEKKLTFIGKAKERLKLIEEYNIFKMTQEFIQKRYPT